MKNVNLVLVEFLIFDHTLSYDEKIGLDSTNAKTSEYVQFSIVYFHLTKSTDPKRIYEVNRMSTSKSKQGK